jgi:hypothetical protein
LNQILESLTAANHDREPPAHRTRRFLAAIEDAQPPSEIDRLQQELNQVMKAFNNLLALAAASGTPRGGAYDISRNSL